MEEKKNKPPQNARNEENKQKHNKGHSTNKNITNINTEDKLPHSDKKEEKNNNNKKVTFKEDIKYNTRSATSSKERRKNTVKRKSPRLAKIQRRVKMMSTTSEEYENNKGIRYYIRRQTKTKNDVKAESQPIPDITVL